MQETRDLWKSKNWSAFKKRYTSDKDIEIVETTTNLERIEILESRTGVPTARVMSPNGQMVFLHSSVDPVKEARKIAASVSNDPGKVIVVYGFALGYLVEALLEVVDERNPVFVIEPDAELFNAAMKSRDLCHIIDSNRVYILVSDSPNTIKAHFYAIYDAAKYNDIILTGLMGHQTIYSNFYAKSMTYIKDIVNVKLLNLVTLIKMGPDFVSNALINLADYCTHPGVATLFGRFANIPAIIVSAGPSLNKNIHLLKEAKGKAIIFAVGTAVKALKKWNVEPDFIFSLDPHPLNYEHFKGVDVGGATLVAEIQSNHMVLEDYQGPIFMSGDVAILKWFGDSIEFKGKIESGGSVANNAMATAYKMGANPIILVGQDLAFGLDGHTHAAGTNYADKTYSGGENINYLYVKANDGGKLLTDRSFYQFLTFFQHWIEKYPEREYINATEGGAFIEGTKLMTLQEVLTQYCQETVNLQEIISKAQDSFEKPNLKPVLEILKLRLKDAKKTIAEANTAIKHLAQLETACENKQSKKMQQHLKAIARIYKRIEKDPYIREVAEWFGQHDLHGVFSRTYEAEYSEEDDFHAAIADYRIYYEKVIHGTKSVEDLLESCIKKVRGKMQNGE